jgi:hypothetical protein
VQDEERECEVVGTGEFFAQARRDFSRNSGFVAARLIM